MTILRHFFAIVLLVGSFGISLEIQAQASLPTPNCENPTTYQEKRCCDDPSDCRRWGFEQPELQSSDTESLAEQRKRIVEERASEVADVHRQLGVQPRRKTGSDPTPTAKPAPAPAPAAPTQSRRGANTKPAPQPVEQPAAVTIPKSLLGPRSIRRLTEEDVMGPGAAIPRKPENAADKDARIAVCGGTRDPVIRANTMLLIQAAQLVHDDPHQQLAAYAQMTVKNYDDSYNRAVTLVQESRDAQCRPGAVDKAYTDFAYFQDQHLQKIHSSY